MAINFAEASKSARRMILNAGGTMTVTMLGNKSGSDPVTGADIDIEDDTHVEGVGTLLLDYNAGEIDGTSIKKGDAYVLFHSVDEVETGMQVTINSDTYRVMDVGGITSLGNVNVYKKLQLRK